MKILLKKLVEKGEVHLNTTYAEFNEHYGNDPLLIDTLPKDREFLFNEIKLKLKKLIEESKYIYYI